MKAVTKNGFNLQYASPRLKNDTELVEAVMSKYLHSFQFASMDIRCNQAFVMNKVLNKYFYGYICFQHVHETLRDDEEVAWLAIQKKIRFLSICIVTSSRQQAIRIEGNSTDEETKAYCIEIYIESSSK